MNRLNPSKLLFRKFPFQKPSFPVNPNFLGKKPLTFAAANSFSTSSSWGSQGNRDAASKSYGAIMTRVDSTIARAAGWEDMGDIEDRFQLSKIHDVKKIFTLLRQVNYKHPLNDLVHFLKRIVELNQEKNLKLTVQNSVELGAFVQEIKKNLRHAEQEYPLVGSFAWCFWKLGHQEDTELWLTLGDHIIDGRFHSNFNESMCGIEGFTALNGIAEQPFIDEVYSRLEKMLVLTIVEVDINHYKRLTESLVKVQRFTQYVFENIENHLMHFLSSHELEYDLRLMLDILASFAVSGNGSERLFYSFEQILTTFYSLTPEQQVEVCKGDFVAKLVQTYALAKMMHPELIYDHMFSRMVYEFVQDKEIPYSLEELVNVIQYISMFNFENIEQVYKLLDERLFLVKGEMKGDDMIRYIDLKVLRDHDEDYSKLPKEILAFFDDYLNKNMEKQEPSHIYHYFSEIEERGLMTGKEEILNHLITYVSQRMHIYDFEALCYFFWLFNKYNTMIKMDSAKIQCDLSSIKDHIRLYSAFSKGRLRIGSNFYKMLEVVSGSDFLTQGEYPDW